MLDQLFTRLLKKNQLNEKIWLFQFSLISPKEFVFTAGQYLILPVKTAAGQPANRLYSLAGQDGKKQSFELLIEMVPGGLASTYFQRLTVGDRVSFQGPAGLFSLKTTGRPVVFLATGSGFAPVRSILLSSLPIDSRPFFLFWGLPTKNDLCLVDELKNLSLAYSNFQFYICLSRQPDLSFIERPDKNHFFIGRVNAGIETILANLPRFDFYLCGSQTVVESLRQHLVKRGVSSSSIIFEKF
jgi:ferredoxin-NADP reductase